MIYMTEDMHTMLAVFADATAPLCMFDAIDTVLLPPYRSDPDRWIWLVQSTLRLWQQGCIHAVEPGTGFRDDLYEITGVGRRIAASRGAQAEDPESAQ